MDTLHTLQGQKTSYVLDSSLGMPVCRYWGQRLHDESHLDDLLKLQAKSFQAAALLNQLVPLTIFPEQGTGFWGNPALSGHRAQQHWATAFHLNSLQQSPDSLNFQFIEEHAQLSLTLEILLDAETDVLQRRTILQNLGNTPYHLNWCAAAAFELPHWSQELLMFHGNWTNEFQMVRQPFPIGTLSRENRRGRTSHNSFPGMIIGSPQFCETSGEIYGFHLGWSGNHRILVECSAEGDRQIQLGELLMPGEQVLSPDESYTSPWTYSCYAQDGLNELSHKFHTFARKHILPQRAMRTPRPVQFNTWEALYFDHEWEALKSLVQKASDLGIERFVLDDGWFCNRNDDHRALGDWWPDPTKYPDGLKPLIDCVLEHGMEFGLWVEPEMVNPDSQLYRQHPDWVLNLDPLPRTTGRNQLVLDLSRSEVSDYLFNSLNKLLSEYSISYLKWDMNRDLTMAGHEGTPAYHQQTHALYALLNRLRECHPMVEIESCASGGGRIDFGILKYAERVWTSDSNDALLRQKIQRGYSVFFPPEIMGAHIGPAECHTSGRKLSLQLRAHTALFGHFGMELDLRVLSPEENTLLKQYIDLYKQQRDLLHHGQNYRLELDDARWGYGVVSLDQKRALFCLIQMEVPLNRFSQRVRFCGLNPNYQYRLQLLPPVDPSIHKLLLQSENDYENGILMQGEMLLKSGILLPMPFPETSILIQLDVP